MAQHQQRPDALECAWCGGSVEVKAAGRLPKWCSSSCRHRAWEQRRAAKSGLAARVPIDRVVEMTVEVGVPAKPRKPRGGEWVSLLDELAQQLDRVTLYNRDLLPVLDAMEGAVEAARRRPWTQRHRPDSFTAKRPPR